MNLQELKIKQDMAAAALDKVQTWQDLKQLIAELAAINKELLSFVEDKEGGANVN